MSKRFSPSPASLIKRTTGISRWFWAAACLASLAACSSTPLPQWPLQLPGSSPRPSESTSIPVVESTTPPDSGVASTTPVRQKPIVALPYSQEVADYFPDPAQSYDTPGLSDEGQHYTSNQALNQLLYQLPLHSADASQAPNNLRLAVLEAGSSQQGQPLYAVLAARLDDLSPDALDDSRRPTVMIVAGQQGNAPASTEAVLALLTQLKPEGTLYPLLEHLQLLLVPRANPDGFEQGIADTANGIDLRQDHLLLHSPEARALASLINRYRPAVVLELGEYPALTPRTELGLPAVSLHDLGLQYALTPNAHEFVIKAEREWFHLPLTQQLPQAGLRVDWLSHTVAANAQQNIQAGLAMQSLEPHSLANVTALKHGIGLSIHSRGSDMGPNHLQRRVHSLVQASQVVLQSTAKHAKKLQEVQAFAARDSAAKACDGTLDISAKLGRTERTISLINTETAAITEQLLPWYSALEPQAAERTSRPCGYWLSPEAQNLAAQLDQLGVRVQRIADLSPLVAEGYTEEAPLAPEDKKGTDAGAGTSSRIQTQRILMDATPGSYYISLSQPFAHLASAVLEPHSPFSSYRQGTLGQLSQLARVITPPDLVFAEDD